MASWLLVEADISVQEGWKLVWEHLAAATALHLAKHITIKQINCIPVDWDVGQTFNCAHKLLIFITVMESVQYRKHCLWNKM